MAYSTLPISGVNFNATVPTNVQIDGTTTYYVPTMGPLGIETFGSDGKRYVLAQANATITASTTTCTVDPATFLVTATGGSYKSPAIALASGDVAWFSIASV
jgi:hypothetical protein